MNPLLSCAFALVASAILTQIPQGRAKVTIQTQVSAEQQAHPYVGMWMTVEREVHHNLLANGRYDETRDNRESAYQSRYEVPGDEIFYWDNTGSDAEGILIDDVLHHGGMILHRAN